MADQRTKGRQQTNDTGSLKSRPRDDLRTATKKHKPHEERAEQRDKNDDNDRPPKDEF